MSRRKTTHIPQGEWIDIVHEYRRLGARRIPWYKRIWRWLMERV